MSNPAETYESFMVPTLFAPWAARLIQSANPQSGERVLDVATGTGIVARRVAPCIEPNGSVIGLDLNPNMLEAARAAGEREGLDIEWREGTAENLPFPDDSFALVLCQFGLMFFADRPAALAEMHRVLTPNGRVALSVFQSIERHPFYQTLHNIILERFGMSGVQDIFVLGDVDELRTLFGSAGFPQVEIESVSMTARFPNPEAFLAGEIAVDTAAIPSMQHLDAQARQAITAAIREKMEAPLRDVTQDNHVVLPFHAYIVGARC